MDKITVKCEACGEEYTLPAAMAGTQASCKCGRSIQVPALEGAEPEAEAPAEAAAEAPAKPTAKWYVSKGGQSKGPFCLADLQAQAVEGKLGPENMVYGPGSDQWRHVREVPELAPFAAPDGAAAAPPPPSPAAPAAASETVRRPAPRSLRAAQVAKAKAALHKKKSKAGPKIAVGVVVLAALVVGAVMLSQREVPGPGPTSTNTSTGQPTGTQQTPNQPGAAVKAWLGLFVKKREDVAPDRWESVQQSIKPYCLGGRPDAYAADVRERLRTTWRARGDGEGIQIVETECDLVRAEKGDVFCYHVAPGEGEEPGPVRVSPAQGEAEESETTFPASAFRKLRCFEVRSGESMVHPSARVLAVDEGGKLKIVACGRLAHVGAKAGSMHVRYVTGRKAGSMQEMDSALRVGVEPMAGLVLQGGRDWQEYGELISADSRLVPKSVLERRLTFVSEDTGLVISLRTGKALSEATHVYGEPQITRDIVLPSAYYKVVHAGPDAGWGFRVELQANNYGNFALAVKPDTGEIVGFLFRQPAVGM